MRLGGVLVISLAAVVLALSGSAGAMPDRTLSGSPQENAQPAAPGAIANYVGLPVQSVDFPGAEDPGRLRELIPQKAGDPLDRERLRASMQVLFATGRYSDIQVEAERTADNKVKLTFVTEPNFFVGEIQLEGAPAKPTTNQIVNATKLQLGELFSRQKLERSLQNIGQLMVENGFYHSSTLEQEQRHLKTQQVDLLFHITPGPQARVGQVTVSGNPGYSQGQIQDIAKLHPGDSVAAEKVSRGLERVRKKFQKQNRLLAQVSIERTYRPEANAVDYTLHVDPGPVTKIDVEGFKIKRSVIKRNIPVYEEDALDDDLLNEGRRNLLNYLQTRGYFEARVGIRKETNPTGNELHVIYVVDEGERHRLVKVDMTGNHYLPDSLLRERMQVQQAGRLFSHGRFSQALLNDDLKSLENLYHDSGFQQVKVSSNVVDNYQNAKNSLAVAIQIEEGPQTLVSALHIVGNKKIPQDDLQPLNTVEGQPFSESNIASDREIILNYYYNHGFPNASFDPAANPVAGETRQMDVTYTIQEGDQVFVDQVLVSGSNHTKPFVVQRELTVKPETPVSQADMLETQRRLYDLGIFGQVDTAVQNPDGTEPEKNVLVQVQEAKRYTFNYGFGLEFQTGQPAVGSSQPQGETGVSPRVSFDVSRINLRGRNETISFKTHVGRLQQRALISFDEPRWFGSRDWRLSFTSFYDNTLDVTTFTSQRLEGSVQAEETISRRFSDQPVSTMVYRFTYRRVKAANFASSFTPDQVPLLSQPVRVGFPGFSYIRDKRDNPLTTTKGNYTTIDGSVADSHFGSEADFSRYLIQNSTYQPFGKNRTAERKYVLARSTRIGVENAFGNTTILQPGRVCPEAGQTVCPGIAVVPLPERFFSGGGNSHRGFGLNQAGPRDPGSGFPVGGSALFINNIELRFPPVSLPYLDDNVSFAIFHDMGNVFTTGNDMLHSLLRWHQSNPQLCLQESTANQCNYNYISHAIGVGVRYKTPIGPVRFDFGYNLNPPAFPSFQLDPDTQKSIFVPQHARRFNVSFSIGQTF